MSDDYARWKRLLGHRFFPEGIDDANVLFCIDEDELIELSQADPGLMPLPDAVTLRCPNVRSDSRWFSVRTDVASADFPESLPVLAVMVLAVSHQRTHAFYRPFRELVGPAPSDDDDGQPPGFERLIIEWRRLAEWARHHARGTLDLGRPRGNWDMYFYPARRQAIFKTRNIKRDLPRFFIYRNLLVAGERVHVEPAAWSRETDVFLAWCGGQADTKLRSYAGSLSADLRAEIQERLEATYADWDGSIEDEQGRSHHPKLNVCWEIDQLLPGGGRLLLALRAGVAEAELGLDLSALSFRQRSTNRSLSARQAGDLVLLDDGVNSPIIDGEDVLGLGAGGGFEAIDRSGRRVRLTLSPPLYAQELELHFRHLVEDEQTYLYVERRSRLIGASSTVIFRTEDAERLSLDAGACREPARGLCMAAGNERLLDRLGVAVQSRDDMQFIGGLRIGSREWVEGAGPDIAIPSETRLLRVTRPGHVPVDVTCARQVLRWSELEVPAGPAFTLEAFDERGRALGTERQVFFVEADQLLRRAPRPASTRSESAPSDRKEALPASTVWLISIGRRPGEIVRQDFGSSTRKRVPPPLRAWLESDALLLSLPECGFDPIALITGGDSGIGSWWVRERDKQAAVESETEASLGSSRDWAEWVLYLPKPTQSLQLGVVREAAAEVLRQREHFSSAWIRRAEELLS